MAILLVSVGGTVYFQFFSGPAKNLRPKNTVYPPAVPSAGSAAPPTAPAASAPISPRPAISVPGTALLPYGSAINTAIFEQEKFKALKPAPPLSIKSEELGVEDLFGR